LSQKAQRAVQSMALRALVLLMGAQRGCLLVSKAGYSSCDITVDQVDERMLRIIQNKLGGAIKPRSGVKAIRWRLNNRSGMLALVKRINGYIRHSSRLAQLNLVCAVLNMPLLSPDTLHNNMVDLLVSLIVMAASRGYYLKGPSSQPHLKLSVTNKRYVDVVHFLIFSKVIFTMIKLKMVIIIEVFNQRRI